MLYPQASCGFCQPPVASSLTGTADSSSSSSSSLRPSVLLDECQDDINVCPFLAATGLCGGGSLWVETQCARSCGQCASTAATQPTAAAKTKAAKLDTAGSSDDSSSGSSSGLQPPAASLAVIPDVAQGSPKPSGVKIYGRHSAAGALTAQELQEWHIPGCKDHQVCV
jgi:hypothetical protein